MLYTLQCQHQFSNFSSQFQLDFVVMSCTNMYVDVLHVCYICVLGTNSSKFAPKCSACSSVFLPFLDHLHFLFTDHWSLLSTCITLPLEPTPWLILSLWLEKNFCHGYCCTSVNIIIDECTSFHSVVTLHIILSQPADRNADLCIVLEVVNVATTVVYLLES